MVAQVEGMALPAARREVAEVALPDPRPGQLAVEEEQRLATGPSFGQPGLDVQAAGVELDLVLANGPAVLGRDLGAGEDLLRRRFGHAASPLVRIDDETRQGLGVEIGR